MSTMLADKGTHVEVSTLVSPGKRRHIPRGAVLVPKGDREALKAEMVRQADAARKIFGLLAEPQEPVV